MTTAPTTTAPTTAGPSSDVPASQRYTTSVVLDGGTIHIDPPPAVVTGVASRDTAWRALIAIGFASDAQPPLTPDALRLGLFTDTGYGTVGPDDKVIPTYNRTLAWVLEAAAPSLGTGGGVPSAGGPQATTPVTPPVALLAHWVVVADGHSGQYLMAASFGADVK